MTPGTAAVASGVGIFRLEVLWVVRHLQVVVRHRFHTVSSTVLPGFHAHPGTIPDPGAAQPAPGREAEQPHMRAFSGTKGNEKRKSWLPRDQLGPRWSKLGALPFPFSGSCQRTRVPLGRPETWKAGGVSMEEGPIVGLRCRWALVGGPRRAPQGPDLPGESQSQPGAGPLGVCSLPPCAGVLSSEASSAVQVPTWEGCSLRVRTREGHRLRPADLDDTPRPESWC